MTLRLLQTASLIALCYLPALLPAQETTGKEEERLATLARNDGEWNVPKSKISIGFRVLNSGGTVNFSNLGIVPSIRAVPPDLTTPATRAYDNGVVYLDSPRVNELDANGNQITVPGMRYLVTNESPDGVIVVVEDRISYTPNLTREWETLSDKQFSRPGYASFSTYSATSDGGSAQSEQGATAGVEFQLSRDLGRRSGSIQWRVMAGITLNDINGQSTGTVSSSLNTHTDYYAYTLAFGQPVPAGVYQASNFLEIYDANGVLVNQFGYETSAVLAALPDTSLSTDQSVAGAASVTGNWQVKGSYFLLRVGPSFHAQLTDRLGLSASIGFAGAYAGTNYSVHEFFSNPDNPGELIELGTSDTPLSSTTTEFLSGYFADLNLDWTANETVGIFGGITAQQLGSYEQKLGDRSAKIDLGSAYGLRGGISIRF